jgi:hypothetical protein
MAPTKEDIASARVFVQSENAQVPFDGEWYVLSSGDVWVHYRESDGWAKSMFSADTVTSGGGWVEKAS